MFTGIIEELGQVAGLERRGDSAVLSVRASKVAADVVHGASIAVNGVCLTVVGWSRLDAVRARLRRDGRDPRPLRHRRAPAG